VPWRVDEVPTTTAVPTSTPDWISAYELLIKPTVTETSWGWPAESRTRTQYDPADPTSATVGTAITAVTDAMVTEIWALMPEAVPAGGVGSETRIA